jgi:hypothetical protein
MSGTATASVPERATAAVHAEKPEKPEKPEKGSSAT